MRDRLQCLRRLWQLSLFGSYQENLGGFHCIVEADFDTAWLVRQWRTLLFTLSGRWLRDV